MSLRARIVGTLSEPVDAGELARLSEKIDILEVRADLVRGLEVEWLRSHFKGELLYTLRSREEGGRSEASLERRHDRLAEAARHYDLVDLEVQRDLSSDLLHAIPPTCRILSWHGPPSSLMTLQGIFGDMAAEGARYYKLVPSAEQHRQEMAPLALLHSLKRSDVIAFASGTIGGWTRLLAPRLGAAVVYGSAVTGPAAPGQPSVDRLIDDFFLPELPDVEELFGVVGTDIDQSLSPKLHNWFYRQLGVPCLYLPFPVEAFGEFWLEVVEGGSFEELGYSLRGLSITAPHKTIAAAVAGACSPLVESLGSANTLVCREGVWEAESTDGEGIVAPLRERGERLSGRQVLVLGAGGAGRAAVTALRGCGADVTLANRGTARGRKAAADLHVPFRSLDGLDPGSFEIVVQATSLGRHDGDPLPLDPARLGPNAIVVDMVYRASEPTPLVREVRAAGGRAIDGREVLVFQAAPQFLFMTGQEMSIRQAKEIVGLTSET